MKKGILTAIVAILASASVFAGEIDIYSIPLRDFRGELLKLNAKQVKAIILQLQEDVSEACGIPLDMIRQTGKAPVASQQQDREIGEDLETEGCFTSNIRLIIANLVMVNRMRAQSMDYYRQHSTISDRGNRVGPGHGRDENSERPVIREGNGRKGSDGGLIIDRTGGVDTKRTRKGGMLVIERK